MNEMNWNEVEWTELKWNEEHFLEVIVPECTNDEFAQKDIHNIMTDYFSQEANEYLKRTKFGTSSTMSSFYSNWMNFQTKNSPGKKSMRKTGEGETDTTIDIDRPRVWVESYKENITPEVFLMQHWQEQHHQQHIFLSSSNNNAAAVIQNIYDLLKIYHQKKRTGYPQL